MKTNIILLIIITLCCNIVINNAQPLNKKQLQNHEKEIDSVFLLNVEAARSLDTDKLYKIVNDKYKAGFITAGTYYSSFDTLMLNFISDTRKVDSQNIYLNEKKITVLSEKFAILTASGNSEIFLNDGTSFSGGFNWSFVYENINGEWKVIQSHLSRKR